MSDNRVRISVRNARLLRAIERAGHRPGAPFAAAVGISYSELCEQIIAAALHK